MPLFSSSPSLSRFVTASALLGVVGASFVGCSDGATTPPADGGVPVADGSVDTGTIPPVVDGSTPPADAGATGTSYVYSADPSPAGADALLALVNARGAEGRAYIGPYLGSGLPTSGAELFVRPTPRVTLAYRRETAVNEAPAAFVARLDAAGAQGFAFKGPLLLGLGKELLFVKDTARGATYTYTTTPGSDDEATTLQTLDERGARGFAYLTDIVTDDTQPLGSRVRLFQKVTSATPATYRYAFSAATTDRAATEAELAARGRTGAVWKGALAFGATSRFLFETASTTVPPVTYAFEDDPGTDANAAVAKLDPRGAEGFYFLGPYLLGGKSTLVLVKGPPTALALTGTVLP